jgi:hypothetical protein
MMKSWDLCQGVDLLMTGTTVQAEKTSGGTLRVAIACAAVVMLAFVLAQALTAPLGHDQVLYLFEARRFLSGAEIYGPRLMETNPPLIIWFSAIPVLVGNWLGISDTAVLAILLVLLIAGSVAWSFRILRRGSVLGGGYVPGLLGLALLAIELHTGELHTGIFDFGQREHLLILFLMPYLLAVVTGSYRQLGFVERCALGVAAGIALWFKPHDALIPAALEIYLAVRTRSLRRIVAPEVLALITTCLVLLAAVRIATPLYFRNVLPLLTDTYWALGSHTAFALARSLSLYTAVVLLLLVLCFVLRHRLREPAAIVALLICSFAASIAYDLQHTMWGYHRYPQNALLALAVAFIMLDLASTRIESFVKEPASSKVIAYTGFALLAAFVCVLAIRPTLWNKRGRSQDPPQEFFAHLAPSTTVYAFSTSVVPLAEAYRYHLRWGGRFALWMLPALVQNEVGPVTSFEPFKRLDPARLAELEDQQRAESAEDLEYWKPMFVLVQHCSVEEPCQGIEGKNFDMLAWFSKSAAFSEEWVHYQKKQTVDNFDVYQRVF